MKDDKPGDAEFEARRIAARARIEADVPDGETLDERKAFFEAVYERAGDDAAAVPWADLKPRSALVEWLETRAPAQRGRAVDIACGLGDNAEAISAAGYETTAFDFSERAVSWAKARFSDSPVRYQVADMFSPPEDWLGSFDLVHECYTIQSLQGALRRDAFAAIAALVKPGGTLLLIARSRPDGSEASGPPWPLMPSEIARFDELGLTRSWSKTYDVVRPDKTIPHVVIEFAKKQ